MIAIFVLALVGFALLGSLPVQRRFEQQGLRQERLWKLCLAQGEEYRGKALKLGEQTEVVGDSQVRRVVSLSTEPNRWLLQVFTESQGSKVQACWVVPKGDSP